MNTTSNIFDKGISSIRDLYNKIDRVFSHEKSIRIGWGMAILICFSIILGLNIFTPLSADDFGYLYIHAEDVKVASLSDVLRSQINHYYLWGGRSVVHFIAQSILLLPSIMIDLLNSLVYLGYIFLIYFHIIGREKNSLSLFILINLIIWLIQPAYGDTILWTTGSANYLWGTSIVLLLLLPFRLYQGEGSSKNYTWLLKSAGMFLGGILAGWTNENTAAALLAAIVLFLIYYRSKNWRIPGWSIFGLLGCILGYVVMILAPGNMVRAGDAVMISPFLILYRFLIYTQTLFDGYGIFILFYLLFIILLWHFTKAMKTEILKVSLIYLVAAIIGIYSMLLSPAFPSRAWFGPLTFSVIALGVVFYRLDYSYKLFRQIRFSILLVFMMMFLFSFYDAARDVSEFYKVSEQRKIQAENAKEEGLGSYEFRRYKPKTKFVHAEDPRSNFMMKGYYGIDIVFEEE